MPKDAEPKILTKTTSQAGPAKSSGDGLKVSYKELEQHNVENDAWVAVRGKVYDITQWIPQHPGGTHILKMMAGRDITYIFDSYHKLATVNMLGTAKVPYVGELENNEFPLFEDSDFYDDLRGRVEKYFKDNKVDNPRNVNLFVVCNFIFIFGTMLTCYYYSMYSSLSFFTCFLLSILAGFSRHLSMVHIFHDASHCCLSRHEWVWKAVGCFGDMVTGQSMDVWIHRHIVGHHVYTNISGIDPDLGIYKVSPKTPVRPYRSKRPFLLPTNFQFLIYVATVLQMQVDDFFTWARKAMETTAVNPYVTEERGWIFYGAKLTFITFRLILPILLGYRSVLGALTLFLTCEITVGILFGVFSQITHISEEVEWPSGCPIPKGWGETQVLTAHDYGHESFFWTYISGYLNYQVVHHLFPSIAPHYYPKILPIVKQACADHNVPYSILPSFWVAWQKHWNHVKSFQHYLKRKKQA
eukprot:CAMPEP_0174260396 /NCGR_PEP_ID=MMETSP0439-20130205/9681_1 /TAXON_ID=0 /ORGANISM="Stereomyxa ramosa, Strain Chinc5" /LENGTH=468 /DNA_ID=CAMNT_0015344631 /DNA_START=71 /DNA_END=1477 /DNA_ORIENTATION=+